jgi:hypothetical protein
MRKRASVCVCMSDPAADEYFSGLGDVYYRFWIRKNLDTIGKERAVPQYQGSLHKSVNTLNTVNPKINKLLSDAESKTKLIHIKFQILHTHDYKNCNNTYKLKPSTHRNDNQWE